MRSLVAQASRGRIAGSAGQAVPAGSTVTPLPQTWSPDGTGGGTMSVTLAVPGRAPVTYAAIMVHESGGWKVMATIALPK
jgi:hypothetical protein